MPILARRNFLIGLPAIIPASSLMPVHGWVERVFLKPKSPMIIGPEQSTSKELLEIMQKYRSKAINPQYENSFSLGNFAVVPTLTIRKPKS